MPDTHACAVCPDPVVLADEHITVTRQLQTERDGATRVVAVQVLGHLHVRCSAGLTAVRPATIEETALAVFAACPEPTPTPAGVTA